MRGRDSFATYDEGDLRRDLSEHRRRNWRGIQTAAWQERILEQLIHPDFGYVFDRLGGVDALSGKLVIDVGCGVGSFAHACAARGIRIVGVEPDRIGLGAGPTAISIARKRLGPGRVVAAAGEHLPFRGASADVVTLLDVLEHVQDPLEVLCECLRVVRPGGVVYVESPNYWSFWEPHYKIPWLPLFPKGVARWYLRLLGRDPVMLQQLQYTSHRQIRALAERLAVRAVDLQWEDMRARLDDPTLARRRTTKAIARLWRSRAWRGPISVAIRGYQRLRFRGVEYLISRTG